MLLRMPGAYPLVLSDDLSSAIGVFGTTLQQNAAHLTFNAVDTRSSQQLKLEACLHAVLMACWRKEWTVTNPDVLPCPTHVYLMLLSINPDGGFKEPKLITHSFAGLQFCMRIAFLHEIWSTAQQQSISYITACHQLDRWFTEKQYNTPFNTVRSLQHRASAIAYATPNLPAIWWTDQIHYQSLLWKGNAIHLDNLIQMFHQMEDDLLALWKTKILLGLDICVDLVSKLKLFYKKLSSPLLALYSLTILQMI